MNSKPKHNHSFVFSFYHKENILTNVLSEFPDKINRSGVNKEVSYILSDEVTRYIHWIELRKNNSYMHNFTKKLKKMHDIIKKYDTNLFFGDLHYSFRGNKKKSYYGRISISESLKDSALVIERVDTLSSTFFNLSIRHEINENFDVFFENLILTKDKFINYYLKEDEQP